MQGAALAEDLADGDNFLQECNVVIEGQSLLSEVVEVAVVRVDHSEHSQRVQS